MPRGYAIVDVLFYMRITEAADGRRVTAALCRYRLAVCIEDRRLDMCYEPNYSSEQIHFLSASSELLPLLHTERRVSAVLDLGAGGGRSSFHLRRLYPEALLVPLDLSWIRCAACRKVIDAPVVCGDALELAFRAQAFGLIVCTQVIEHVPDDRALVAEIQRVLRPGGTAIVSSVLKMRYGWYLYRNHLGEWVLDPTHVREYRSLDEFLALFQPPLGIVDVCVDRFRFSVAAFIYRLLLRSRVVSTADPMFFSGTRLGRLLGPLRVAIPRYRRVTVAVTKV